MPVLSVLLLAVGVASLFVHFRVVPHWVVPCGAALVVWGLGVVTTAEVRATVDELASPPATASSTSARRRSSPRSSAGSATAGAAAAINNLPALLLAMPLLPRSDGIWALLLGVNMGPAFVLSGSLAGFLWRDTARMMGVRVSGRTYSRVGLRVGGPAFVAAVVTLLATNALLG